MFACCAAALPCAAPAAAENLGAHICKPRAVALPDALRNAPDGPDASFAAEADEIESRGGTLRLRGNARMLQGARGLFAEEILYDRAARRAEAAGEVALYTARGDALRAERAEVNLDDFSGEARGVRIALAAAPPGESGGEVLLRARASASRVQLESDSVQHLENARMSNCVQDARPAGRQDVVLGAKRITLDHARGLGTAKSMTLKFKRVPIFYFPRVTFPINDRRRSGFLFPSAGYADGSGAVLETPFYLNLAPNYDARLTPRLLSRRGAQLAGRFRYLSAYGRGELRGEGMSSDRQFAREFDERANGMEKLAERAGAGRHALSYIHRHARGNWRAAVDLQVVSDRAYQSDFAGADAAAESYTARTAEFLYRAKHFELDVRAAAYDAAHEDVPVPVGGTFPHAVLPRVRFAALPPQLGPFAGELGVEYARFRYDDDANDKNNDDCGGACGSGARWRATPRISMPLRGASGYFTPSASLHAVRYALNNPGDKNGMQKAREASVPVYALDAGLFFRRGGANYVHSIEPRLRYVRIPYVEEQKKLPVFDTGAGSMSGIAHYFRENRFLGGDRVGDTEQVALGLGGRAVRAADGAQLLHFQLGKVFYFEDRKLGLDSNNGKPETGKHSGLLAELAARGGALGVTAFARGGRPGGGLDAARLSADYRKDARRGATLAYRYDSGKTRNESGMNAKRDEQLNLAIDAPLGAARQLRAQAAHSLETGETHSSSLTLRFDGCCWAANIGWQRYLDGEGARKARVLFTLELAGLGRLGSRP